MPHLQEDDRRYIAKARQVVDILDDGPLLDAGVSNVGTSESEACESIDPNIPTADSPPTSICSTSTTRSDLPLTVALQATLSADPLLNDLGLRPTRALNLPITPMDPLR